MVRFIKAPYFCENFITKTPLFILFIVTLAFRPILPMIEYIVRFDKIVNEYCVNAEKPELLCNGVCYLKNQLSKSLDSDSEKNKQINPNINTADFFVLDFFEQTFLDFSSTLKIKNYYHYLDLISQQNKLCLLQPPSFRI